LSAGWSKVARIRSVNPKFWKSLTLAKLSREERLFFIGLWNVADDEGRGFAEPKLLKGELFSMDDDVTGDTISVWLKHLATLKLVFLYADNLGRPLYAVRSWEEYQRPEKPKASELAAPETSGKRPRRVPDTSPTLPAGNGKRNRNRKGNGKGDAEPPGNWPADAAEIFKAEIGFLPIGRFGRTLAPAVAEYGWDGTQGVKRWFTAYCRSRPYQKANGSIHGDNPGDTPEGAHKDTRWVSPEDFMKSLTFWRERCAPMKNQ